MSIIDIVLNIFEVLPRDIERSTQDTYIQAVLITGFFYFISKWFRAYILKLGLFLFGSFVVFQVFQGQSFLNRFDFYAGLGLLLPHIEVVELTYLLLKERILFLYTKILELILLIASPFVWLFNISKHFLEFFKAKQEEKTYKRDQSEYERKSRDFKEERESKHQKQKQYQEQTQQKPSKKEKKTYEWWESTDYYERLKLKKGASKSELEKAKRKLRKLYHPDLVFKDENKRAKHTIIFQNVNNAYDEIMKTLK